jgi:toxin CptA
VQFPILIGLHRSRFLDALLLMTVLLASAAIWRFQCSPPMHTALFLAILVLAAFAWRALRPTIKTIRLERNGDIFIVRTGESDFLQAVPKPGATIHPWLTIIRFTTVEEWSATLIATVDSKNAANLRRLRMFMRWQASFSGPNDDA